MSIVSSQLAGIPQKIYTTLTKSQQSRLLRMLVSPTTQIKDYKFIALSELGILYLERSTKGEDINSSAIARILAIRPDGGFSDSPV